MMRRFIFSAMFLLTLWAHPLAAREALSVDLASNHVDITTGFNGSDIVLFGVKNGSGDLIVTVKGPLKTMVVRKKNSVLGAWMNTESITFENVPGFYRYALSADIKDYNKKVFQENIIGLDNLDFQIQDKDASAELRADFLGALKRNKQTEYLWSAEPLKIEMIGEHLFKLSVYVPANVPVGLYEIKTMLVNGQRVRDEKVTTLNVEQVGRNAQIYDFAIHASFYYGLLCVFMAVFAGWLINVIRSK